MTQILILNTQNPTLFFDSDLNNMKPDVTMEFKLENFIPIIVKLKKYTKKISRQRKQKRNTKVTEPVMTTL